MKLADKKVKAGQNSTRSDWEEWQALDERIAKLEDSKVGLTIELKELELQVARQQREYRESQRENLGWGSRQDSHANKREASPEQRRQYRASRSPGRVTIAVAGPPLV